MNSLKIYGWGKKVKTSLKNIKPGDVFCFALGEKNYGVGRIMTRNSLGHVVEVFNQVLSVPIVESIAFDRLGDPIIIDSYSLFDRKSEGDWRVVAYQENYTPSTEESVRFVYGVAGNVKLVDIFDNETPCSGMALDFPFYSPMGDEEVKNHFRL